MWEIGLYVLTFIAGMTLGTALLVFGFAWFLSWAERADRMIQE